MLIAAKQDHAEISLATVNVAVKPRAATPRGASSSAVALSPRTFHHEKQVRFPSRPMFKHSTKNGGIFRK
jgi:hypothetical protein